VGWDESSVTIFVGAVYGGGGETSFSAALSSIRRIVKVQRPEQRVDLGDIDLVFHVPGSVRKPDYHGVRTGRFSRKERMLMIQVAVPEKELEGENPECFIFWAMREAVSMAAAKFKKANIPFSVTDHLALIDTVEAEYRELKINGCA